MTVVKICGIRSVADAELAVSAGADMIGLVFASSRRQITVTDAEVIVAALHRAAPQVKAVGVFVDEPPENINAIAQQCHLDYAQLSGTESDELIERVRVPVIKTLHVGRNDAMDELEERIKAVPAAFVLLDSRVNGRRGGTGQAFDWLVVPRTKKKVILAGGLDPANVREAIRIVQPWGVDVSSGVEVAGQKDGARIEEFIGSARRVDGGDEGGLNASGSTDSPVCH